MSKLMLKKIKMTQNLLNLYKIQVIILIQILNLLQVVKNQLRKQLKTKNLYKEFLKLEKEFKDYIILKKNKKKQKKMILI